MTQPETRAMQSEARPDDQARIVAEEERTLARIQKYVESRGIREVREGLNYDEELLSLRDQIREARLEDVPPLIEEMERLAGVAERRAQVTEGAIDAESPYFGRLVLEEGERKREVLIGKCTYLDPRTNVRIVDWRDAPVSRIYYRYQEGDEYEEVFGGREVVGEVVTRRSVVISSRVLRRIGAPQGVYVRTREGDWRRAVDSASRLSGGQGAAMRAEEHHKPGKLGIGGEGRDDRFLPEITALIDPRQFDLITRSDAGLVVIQGGAGSGKTTIGLHRLAYLAFQDPKRFRPDRMLVVVYNDALVRYIGRVLPALGVSGVQVTTFERWARTQRNAHLRSLPQGYHDDTPSEVTRLKKSHGMLRMIESVVVKATKTAEAWLREALAGMPGHDEAIALYRTQSRLPLGVRLSRLARWASEGGPSDPDGPPRPRSVPLRHAIERVVQRARRELLDVSLIWAEMLTDRDALRAVFDAHAPGVLDDNELDAAVRWCVQRTAEVVGDVEQRREQGDAEPKRRGAKQRDDEGEAEEEDDDEEMRVGVDGVEEKQTALLDREDDALLLRLVQRLRGPLMKGRERLRYEHILADEAQDLSPVELALILGTANKDRSVTLAGDTAQRLHMDNGFSTWEETLAQTRTRSVLGDDREPTPIEIEPLRVQYRSTHEIIEFSEAVLGPLADPESGNATRTGAPVEFFRFSQSGEAVAFLGEALRELMQAEPRASVAIIARYPEQADLYFKGLKNAEVPYIRRIAEQDFPFKPGIDVTDIRQVKGLEFDYVVLLEVSRATYPATDDSRHLLHIAATRAAHQLWVVASGEPSDLLPKELVERAY